MDRNELKQWLAHTRPDLPGPAVVDLLCDRYRGPGTQFSPVDVEEQFPEDRERDVLATLQLLARAQTGVLRGRWLFFDDQDEEFDLAQEEVDEVMQSQEFFHPVSGAHVDDYEERIGLVYEPGPHFPDARVHTKAHAKGRAR